MIDRELLWKAFPEGYLAVRGVSTLNGSTCVWDTKHGKFAFLRHADKASTARVTETRRKAGGLLPNVDPDDVAAWACVKHALGQLLYPKAGQLCQIAWTRRSAEWPPGQGYQWRLTVHTVWPDGYPTTKVFQLGTDEPAEALVLAIIQAREGLT